MLVIPVYNTVILPDVQYNLESGYLNEEEAAGLRVDDTVIIAVLRSVKEREELLPEDFYPAALLAKVKYLRETEDGVFFTVRTEKRINLVDLNVNMSRISADYTFRTEIEDISEAEKKAIYNIAMEYIAEITKDSAWDYRDRRFSEKLGNVNEIMSIIGPYTDLSPDERYAMLETDSVKTRCNMIAEALTRYKDVVDIQRDISRKIQAKHSDEYREGVIRRQIDHLQEELDRFNPEETSDLKRIGESIEKANLPEDAKKEIDRVFKRFGNLNRDDHEYANTLDYLEFVTSLPFDEPENTEIDLKKAKEILDRSHYGLKKVKDRIIEQIAVMALKKKNAGSIILFTGAAGTGKTSMGKAVADALGRKYARISLGGIKDEAEIRGHRRTYVGAMPGRIMDAIKRTGVKNPVIVLDEVDKLGRGSFNGDPESALLEVLDPEQNATFTDHYLNIPYDLSGILFICTANSTEEMSGPLLDRMEVIELPGYTAKEKFHIVKEHLLDKSVEEAGLQKKNIAISDAVIQKLIRDYTMEAGVRGLKKLLDKIMRQVAVRLLEKETEKVTVKVNELSKFLGSKKAYHDKVLKHDMAGVVTGLAWTEAGGEILFIETAAMRGTGQVNLTGQLGDVMKESAGISVSLVKSLFHKKNLEFKDKDIHIHVPSGSVPKDGPSAGITMFTAVASLVLGIGVDPYLAMTGEVSLRGQVLPIGGLPEKLMAAERAGIKKVLIPLANKEDLEEVPEDTKKALTIIPVDTVGDVAREALGIRIREGGNRLFEGNEASE